MKMNKLLNILFLLPGLFLLVTGCNKDSVGDAVRMADGEGDMCFEIGFAPTARVTTGANFESTWQAGDAIGIFAYDAVSGDVAFSNEKLSYTGTQWVSEHALYWKGRTLKFYAYYPYDETAYDPTEIAFRVQGDQSGATGENYGLSDLMTATNTEGISAGTTVALAFKHELAMIQVEIPLLGKGFGPRESTTVSLTGVQTGVVLNLTGESTPDVKAEDKTGSVKMYLAGKPGDEGNGNSYVYRAVIPVQKLKGGSGLFLISDGRTLYRSTGPESDADLQASQAEVFTRSLPVKSLHTVFISAGTFLMGSPADEKDRYDFETQHKVTLTQGFYMGKYEVTNAQYAAFLNANSIGSNGVWSGWTDTANNTQVLIKEYEWGLKWDEAASEWKPQDGKDDFPVCMVSWYGAKAYADWVGGSLPTEAQWEYACRAGTTTAYFWGDDESLADAYDWYFDNSGKATHEVGTKQPNPWGLYDMCGNVREWCLDSWNFGQDYDGADVENPVGITGSYRIIRGNSCGGAYLYCRSAFRWGFAPTDFSNGSGFRMVFVP